MEQGDIYIQIRSYYGEESDRCLCIVQHGQQNHLCWPVVKAILVVRLAELLFHHESYPQWQL